MAIHTTVTVLKNARTVTCVIAKIIGDCVDKSIVNRWVPRKKSS